jgi:8-oxo-dGTP pyrophosphatase MutT (NUDIX family)
VHGRGSFAEYGGVVAVRDADPHGGSKQPVSWTTFTGAGALVLRDDRLLMIRQRRAYGTHWEIPSGYLDPGESLEQAAAREAVEETAVDVDIGDLVCTMLWGREADRRRNLLAFFVATPVDAAAVPRAQTDEGIEDARYVDPQSLFAEIHPLYQVVLERWWLTRTTGFHVHADVTVEPDGSQSYAFR